MEFSYNGVIMILEKDFNENDDMFIERGNFIIKHIKSIDDYNKLVKLSYIYIYSKFYKCIYSKTIIEQLNNLDN